MSDDQEKHIAELETFFGDVAGLTDSVRRLPQLARTRARTTPDGTSEERYNERQAGKGAESDGSDVSSDSETDCIMIDLAHVRFAICMIHKALRGKGKAVKVKICDEPLVDVARRYLGYLKKKAIDAGRVTSDPSSLRSPSASSSPPAATSSPAPPPASDILQDDDDEMEEDETFEIQSQADPFVPTAPTTVQQHVDTVQKDDKARGGPEDNNNDGVVKEFGEGGCLAVALAPTFDYFGWGLGVEEIKSCSTRRSPAARTTVFLEIGGSRAACLVH